MSAIVSDAYSECQCVCLQYRHNELDSSILTLKTAVHKTISTCPLVLSLLTIFIRSLSRTSSAQNKKELSKQLHDNWANFISVGLAALHAVVIMGPPESPPWLTMLLWTWQLMLLKMLLKYLTDGDIIYLWQRVKVRAGSTASQSKCWHCHRRVETTQDGNSVWLGMKLSIKPWGRPKIAQPKECVIIDI